jgi:hypothetical protein
LSGHLSISYTGDFITVAYDRGPRIFVEALVPALSLLTPRDATVAVLGNHDQEQDPVTVRRAMQLSGIVDLSNAVYTFGGMKRLCILPAWTISGPAKPEIILFIFET